MVESNRKNWEESRRGAMFYFVRQESRRVVMWVGGLLFVLGWRNGSSADQGAGEVMRMSACKGEEGDWMWTREFRRTG